MRALPPGFRFHATDEELLIHYLKPKILGRPGKCYYDMIPEIDICEFEPWQLPALFYHRFNSKELFFFCYVKRKYSNSKHSDRTTETGYWKVTGKERAIMSEDTDESIGIRKTLVFYTDRVPKGKRTNWVSHEYQLNLNCLGHNEDEEKSESLDKFKIYRTEVEKQLGKVIKVVRSDRGGEYYGRHGNVGQIKGPFAKYLEDSGIVAQFTMPGSPEQNGVAERRNRTLMDMTIMEPTVPQTEHVNTENPIDETATDEVVQVPQTQNEVTVAPLRRSTRERRSAIPPDYIVYLGEHDYDIGCIIDPMDVKTAFLNGDFDGEVYMVQPEGFTVNDPNADFAGCEDDRKSTTGYIFMSAGGAVSWKSEK
ncbi:protein CUP-SHAPED COTYLEDON 2 [Eucalyptus grandis]|uniref:protein CUP-SHAPED COTYLEDON 2 n=1 Tax=Eucalyptus grandis TaxID=71139 RepID=UPI00192EC91C|nr:protein CUP-SHAPED COTYLEDON 2 [Eucalyptus grandis]